jgi:hypothetical protein
MIAPRVQIEPFESDTHVTCHHTRCDGRAAKWLFPQTASAPNGPYRSCSVHLARFVELTIAKGYASPRESNAQS